MRAPHSAVLIVFLAVATASAAGAQGVCDQAAAEAKVAEASSAMAGAPRATLAQQAIALCPGLASAHNALGTAFEEQGDPAAAAAAYRQAATLAPAWYLPRLGLGDLALAAGDLDEARRQYGDAMSLAQNDRERLTAEQALSEVPESSSSAYSFKSAEAISRGLKLNETARRPSTRGFGAAEEVSADYYEASDGLAANFSILFEVGSAALLPEGVRQLDEVGKALQSSDARLRFRVEGHASSERDPGFNLTLSQRRAVSVRN